MIGIVIATPGRASLFRTLYSIAYQKEGIHDVLVVGDGPCPIAAEIVEAFGPPFRYMEGPKTRDYGHTQLNLGFMEVRGEYLTYQDDDDIYVPRAFEEMCSIIRVFDEPHPFCGRIVTPKLGLLWALPGDDAILDGHCLVTPNVKTKIGSMWPQYNGDQAYLHNTLRCYDHVTWCDRIWTLTRPKWKLFPVRYGGAGHWTYKFHVDNGGVPGRLADLTLTLEERDCAMLATLEGREPDCIYYPEVVEFAAFAAQGARLVFPLTIQDTYLQAVLNLKQFKSNEIGWPAPWIPVANANTVVDPDTGEPFPDWRWDVWNPNKETYDD